MHKLPVGANKTQLLSGSLLHAIPLTVPKSPKSSGHRSYTNQHLNKQTSQTYLETNNRRLLKTAFFLEKPCSPQNLKVFSTNAQPITLSSACPLPLPEWRRFDSGTFQTSLVRQVPSNRLLEEELLQASFKFHLSTQHAIYQICSYSLNRVYQVKSTLFRKQRLEVTVQELFKAIFYFIQRKNSIMNAYCPDSRLDAKRVSNRTKNL